MLVLYYVHASIYIKSVYNIMYTTTLITHDIYTLGNKTKHPYPIPIEV